MALQLREKPMFVNTAQSASVFTAFSPKAIRTCVEIVPCGAALLAIDEGRRRAVPAEGAKGVGLTVVSGERSRVCHHAVKATKVLKAVEYVSL